MQEVEVSGVRRLPMRRRIRTGWLVLAVVIALTLLAIAVQVVRSMRNIAAPPPVPADAE